MTSGKSLKLGTLKAAGMWALPHLMPRAGDGAGVCPDDAGSGATQAAPATDGWHTCWNLFGDRRRQLLVTLHRPTRMPSPHNPLLKFALLRGSILRTGTTLYIANVCPMLRRALRPERSGSLPCSCRLLLRSAETNLNASQDDECLLYQILSLE